jgi:hypothetical protein
MTGRHHSVKICNTYVSGGGFPNKIRLSFEKSETLRLNLAFKQHRKLCLRDTMITYLLMAGLGLVLAFGAQYGDRSVTRYEPRLVEINPAIPKIFFTAKTLGLMIVAVGLASTAVTAYA